MEIMYSFAGLTTLFGLILIVAGLITNLFPPKKINLIYGFRTRKSMESQEKWTVANQYSSKLSIFIGLGMFIVGLLSFFVPVLKSGFWILSVGLLIFCLLLLVRLTHNRLSRQNDHDN